ncbi:unnamed protein product [Auanema sp. JU1783]|nr:unnamed protein product [Auanema sp. JU1783]
MNTRSAILWLSLCPIVMSMGINMLDVSSMEPLTVNYCNNSELLEQAGLIRSGMGQFLGYECSQDFYHCRWQSDGFRTYKKECKTGLVYDVLGTQNCNYDYNVKTCGMSGRGPQSCNGTDFHCPLSGKCVPLSKRCDGHYDCEMEEDEQNCPLCTAGEFACIISEQCIPLDRRCNGISECNDGTDELDCDVCGHGLFHCPKSGECIQIDERCDGRRHCPHGEDEMLCKKPSTDTKFTCQSRDHQIAMNQVCDGVPQCPDGSDEAYCEVPASQGLSGSFSSIPSSPSVGPPAPQPSFVKPVVPLINKNIKEDEDYEYDEHEESPSFPMLPIMTMPPVQSTQPPARPSVRSMSRIVNPQEKVEISVMPEKQIPRHLITQPVHISVTARPSIPPSTTRKVKNQSKMTSRPFEQPSTAPRLSTTRKAVHQPQVTTAHSVMVKVTSPPVPATISQQNILQSIGSQLNNGMSPELLAKIEKLLAEAENSANKRRKPVTNGRDAGLSPAALMRTFSSRVQKQNN